MLPSNSITYECLQGITWRGFTAIVPGSTAFESMINIACVSFGGMAMHLMLRSWITTRK